MNTDNSPSLGPFPDRIFQRPVYTVNVVAAPPGYDPNQELTEDDLELAGHAQESDQDDPSSDFQERLVDAMKRTPFPSDRIAQKVAKKLLDFPRVIIHKDGSRDVYRIVSLRPINLYPEPKRLDHRPGIILPPAWSFICDIHIENGAGQVVKHQSYAWMLTSAISVCMQPIKSRVQGKGTLCFIKDGDASEAETTRYRLASSMTIDEVATFVRCTREFIQLYTQELFYHYRTKVNELTGGKNVPEMAYEGIIKTVDVIDQDLGKLVTEALNTRPFSIERFLDSPDLWQVINAALALRFRVAPMPQNYNQMLLAYRQFMSQERRNYIHSVKAGEFEFLPVEWGDFEPLPYSYSWESSYYEDNFYLLFRQELPWRKRLDILNPETDMKRRKDLGFPDPPLDAYHVVGINCTQPMQAMRGDQSSLYSRTEVEEILLTEKDHANFKRKVNQKADSAIPFSLVA